MKKIIVEITGDTPLLMHNPAAMRGSEGGIKKIPPPEEEARLSRYLMPDGKTLCLFADHVHRCLIIASKGFRLRGRESILPYMSGSLEVLPEFISLGTQKYEMDVRSVVVQKNRILRARARLDHWKATFELHYDEDVFTERATTELLRDQIFLRAGKAVGLLEYRPQKGGRFGRFHVTKWQM